MSLQSSAARLRPSEREEKGNIWSEKKNADESQKNLFFFFNNSKAREEEIKKKKTYNLQKKEMLKKYYNLHKLTVKFSVSILPYLITKLKTSAKINRLTSRVN